MSCATAGPRRRRHALLVPRLAGGRRPRSDRRADGRTPPADGPGLGDHAPPRDSRSAGAAASYGDRSVRLDRGSPTTVRRATCIRPLRAGGMVDRSRHLGLQHGPAAGECRRMSSTPRPARRLAHVDGPGGCAPRLRPSGTDRSAGWLKSRIGARRDCGRARGPGRASARRPAPRPRRRRGRGLAAATAGPRVRAPSAEDARRRDRDDGRDVSRGPGRRVIAPRRRGRRSVARRRLRRIGACASPTGAAHHRDGRRRTRRRINATLQSSERTPGVSRARPSGQPDGGAPRRRCPTRRDVARRGSVRPPDFVP